MKKITLALILAAFISPAWASNNNFKIDFGLATYGTSKLEGAIGTHLNFLYNVSFLDFALNSRVVLPGLTTQSIVYQGTLAAYFRYKIPNLPLTAFAGPGLGVALELKEFKTGILPEIHVGAEYSIIQRMAGVLKLYYGSMLFTENGAINQFNGAGIEIGLRFSFGDTKRLEY